MDGLAQALIRLAPFWPSMLLGMFLLLVLLLVGFVLLLRAARRAGRASQTVPDSAATPQVASREAALASPVAMRRSFLQGLRLLEAHVAGRARRYRMPWFLLLGETAAGKTTLLEHAGLDRLLRPPNGNRAEPGRACTWWYFAQGIVLDIAGEYVLRADGTGADEAGWRCLLRLLQRYRPRCPLDGIILTIPCADLFGPAESLPARLRQATHKGGMLAEKLWHAQRLLGLRLPVYVLVTKCDTMPGFQSFCQALPAARHEEMFGWSTPYSLETAYTTTWVDEALQSLSQALFTAQLEMQAAGAPGYDRDGLFLFTTSFHTLREPLRGYLDHLFGPSAYHEACFFRGLYFCGMHEAVSAGSSVLPDGLLSPREPIPTTTAVALAAPAAALATPAVTPRPVFVQQVFAAKILPEHGLARPVSKTFQVRNRTVVLAQCLLLALALVWGLGLWRGWRSLEQGKAPLVAVLGEIRNDLHVMAQAPRAPQGTNLPYLANHARNVLEGLTQINTNSLRSVFVPSSWLSGLHGEIHRALVLAYNTLILRAAYLELDKKAREVFQGAVPPVRCSPSGTAEHPLWDTPQFCALERFLHDVTTFETHVRIFNDLKTEGTGTLTQLQQLVQYLFAVELPPDFFTRARYYQAALRDATALPFELKGWESAARARFQPLSSRFDEALHHNNVLLQPLRGLVRHVEALRPDVQAAPHGLQALQALRAALAQTQTVLQQPEVAWVASATFDPGQPFTNLGDMVRKSALLGPAAEQQFQNAAQRAWQRLKGELGAQKTALTGALLQQPNGQLHLALASDVVALHKPLETFVQQKFVVDDGALKEPLARPLPQARIAWNPLILAEAVDLARQYESFVKTALTGVPAALEQALTQLALRHLDASMNARLIQAQDLTPLLPGSAGFRAEDAVQLEIKSLKTALPSLSTLVSTFEQLSLKTSAQSLISVVNFQAVTLLAAVDRLLQEERPYEGKDRSFAWWAGSPAPILAAYEVSNAEALAQALELQRERIKALGQLYAAPLLAWFMARSAPLDLATTRLLTKWNGILTQLDAYETKKPGNSVTALERFMLQETADLATANCLPILKAPELHSGPKDFFLERRASLRGALLSRCQTLATSTARKSYAALTALFNTRLAGQYPFAERADAAAGKEAEPEAIRSFYRLFDQSVPPDPGTLRSNGMTEVAGPQVLTFLQEMTAVRAFFAPWLESKASPPRLSIDVAVDFRVNQASEQAGNQIIDWTLEVGEQTWRSTDSQRQGRWRFGDRVRLTLRWAKDAPMQPSLAGTPSGAKISNQTVVYDYNDRWALLSFIRNHASSDVESEDPTPHTLRFVVGLTPRGSPAEGGNPLTPVAQARVFLRLRLTAGEQKDVLVVPHFPTLAPVSAPQAPR